MNRSLLKIRSSIVALFLLFAVLLIGVNVRPAVNALIIWKGYLTQINQTNAYRMFSGDSEKDKQVRQSLLHNFVKISLLSDAVRRQSFVFIPSSVTPFWFWSPAVASCDLVSFLAIALSKVAMVYGLPPSSCTAPLYGYGYTKADKETQQNLYLYQNKLSVCRRARKFGGLQVFAFDDSGNYKVWKCEK